MKKIKINKKGSAPWSFIIGLIVAVLILVIVFLTFFGNYIWDYLRNLPGGYKYNNKDTVITNISKDRAIIANYYQVAMAPDGKYFKFCTNGDCNNLRESKLYISGDASSGIIYVDINWAIDKRVGTMLNSKVIIDYDILNQKGIYEDIKDYLPSSDDLHNFDNSLYITGVFYREKRYLS